jgi:bifunctional UDP-N-acetylglucosamine pyrophosphorylase/glucosamine-1-phosphate N-acetyltransferase
MNIAVIILAAGNSSRMKSKYPKILHHAAGQTIIEWVFSTARELNPKQIITVVNPQLADLPKNGDNANWNIKCVQQQVTGTASAVACALSSVDQDCDYVIVLYGDTPVITAITLHKMLTCIEHEASICVLGFTTAAPNEYGRLVISNNRLESIIEYREPGATNYELCNSGVMAFKKSVLDELLPLITNDNVKNEYYLTDIIKLARHKGYNCSYIETKEEEVLGINNRSELARVEQVIQNRLRDKMMEQGVSLLDPSSVYFSYDTIIGQDSVIHPNVVFGPKVTIEQEVTVKSFSHIEGALIKKAASVGPFARIRPQSILEERSFIGNFVEVKNSVVGQSSKASHLSYIGDAKIGSNTNIGAGTITCNYDGYNKYRTNIGSNVAVGANSSLIAPLEIGDDVIIGAGSVLSRNIPAGALAIARAPTEIIDNKAILMRAKKSKEKESQ